ncbi:hypothetical protein Tco_0336463 [Tanacetum coccineum]
MGSAGGSGLGGNWVIWGGGTRLGGYIYNMRSYNRSKCALEHVGRLVVMWCDVSNVLFGACGEDGLGVCFGERVDVWGLVVWMVVEGAWSGGGMGERIFSEVMRRSMQSVVLRLCDVIGVMVSKVGVEGVRDGLDKGGVLGSGVGERLGGWGLRVGVVGIQVGNGLLYRGMKEDILGVHSREHGVT